MATSRILSIALALLVVSVTGAFAQNRDIRAQRLIIDDNAGHTIRMQTASVGLSSYTLTWPLTAGTSNYALVTNGSGGVLSWKSIESLSNSWGLNGNTLLGPEVLGSLNNFPLIMVTDSIERMRITTTGNIGIGNALPTQKLQVSGNILIDSARQMQFQNPSATGVTTFQAGAQVGDINYTLPLTSPAGNGYILSSTAGGAMTWISPTSTYKYVNGLTLTGDTVRLGGPLTGATVIPFGTNDLTLSSVGDAGDLIIGKFNTTGIVKNNASGVLSSGKINLNDTTEVTGTLAITNGGTGNNTAGSAGQVIYFDGTKYEYTSTGTSGQVLQSNGALQPTWTSISSLVKANNGVSMSVDTVQLGGTLTKNTSIPFGSNDLTLSSAGNTGNIIIGKFTTAGIVKNNASGVLSSGKINLNDTSEVNGTLSITNGGTGNNLPGAAGQVLYFDGTKYNYTSTGTTGQILISNGAGAPTWINPSTTLTYNNGLTVTGDTLQLGGALIKNTSIPFGSNNLTLSSAGNTGNIIIGKFTTSGIVKNNASGVLSSGKINLNDTSEVNGTLSITNGGTGNNLPGAAGQVLYFDGTKYNYTSTGSTGQILISNGAGAPTWINPSTTLTYNNGLTVTGDTLQLGGALIKNTSIPFGSNNLTLSSAGNTGNIIIGKFTTSGIVKNNASGVLSSGKINLNDTSEVNGTLSITNGGTGNNLPGAAGQVLYFDGTKYNYTSTGTTGQILISNGAGAPTWINPSTTLTYNNGLTVTGDTLQLGGTLIKNTSIPFGSNNLTLSSAGNTGNIIIGKFTTAGIVKNNASGVLSSGKINLNDTSEVNGTLSITNGGTGNNLPGAAGQVLYFDGTKYNYTSTGTSGQILISNGSGAPTWINPSTTLTYNNGLTVTGDTLQLGGALVKNTSIPFGSNDLTLSSAGNTGNIIIGKFTSAGIVKNNASGVLSSGQVNLASASEVTGTLGITNGGTNNTAAGSAGQVVYYDGSKYEYTSTGTAGQVLQSNGALQPTWTSISSLVKANNGVTLSTDTVQLGGTLTKNTSIPFGSNDLTLSSAGNTGNIIIGKFTSAGIVKNSAAGVLSSGTVNLASVSEVSGTLGVSNGGTGNTSVGPAGTVAYSNGSIYTFNPAGSAGQILQLTGGVPTWTSVSAIVKANNGVSLSADTVQLGGTLNKNTSIDNSTFNLSIGTGAAATGDIIFGNTNVASDIIVSKFSSAGIVKNSAAGVLSSGTVNLASVSDVSGTLGVSNGGTGNTSVGPAGTVAYSNGSIYTFNPAGSAGQILQLTGGVPTWTSVSAIVKANNGTSLSADTVQLGGTLTKNTSIDNSTFNLSLGTGAAATGDIIFGNTNVSSDIIVSKFSSAGIVKNSAAGVLSSGTINLASASDVSGTLGISNGGTNATTIGAAGTVAYSNGSAYAFSPVGTTGQVLQSNGAGQPTWVTPAAATVTAADNGLNVEGTTVELGGTLNETTTIDNSTFNLSLGTGAVATGDIIFGNTNASSDIIVSKFSAAGIVKNSAAGVLSSGTINLASASEVSGTLGITNGGTNATTIGPAGTVAYSNGTGYTFSTAGTSGQLLTSGGAGAPTWTSVSTILNSLTADNGLTKSSSTNVQLGGALTANTTLTQAGFNMIFQKTGTGNVQLTNTGTANQLQLFEPSGSGTNFSAFLSQAQTSDLKYVLPAVGGNANQVLSVVSKTGAALNDTTITLGWTSASAATVTAADNGLNVEGTTVELGGTLNETTTIDNSTFNLSFGTGAVATGDIIFGNTNASSDIIVSKFSAAGIVKNSAAGVLSSGTINLASASEVSGTLGISNGGTNATTIGPAGTVAYSNGTGYTFSTAGTSGQLLTSGGAGAPTWTSVSTILNSLTADNGLTKSSSTNVQLGGALTANTTLTQAGFNMIFQKTGTGNVQLTNTGTANQLQLFEPSGSGTNFSAFLSQAQTSDLKYVLPAVGGNANQVLSVVSKTGAALNDTTITLGWTSASAATVTAADNGLNVEGTTVELGGTLNETTTIDNSTFNLSFGTGAVATGDIIFGNTNASSDIIVSKFSAAGIVKNSAAGVLSSGTINLASASEVSGTLGISNGGTNATTIGPAGTVAYSNGTGYTFSTAGTSGQLLTSGGAGAPTWTSVSTILNSLTADNGLTKSSSTNVQLGGALTANTTLTQAGFNMIFQKTGTGNVQLTNTGTANQLQLFEPSGSGTNFSAFLSQAQTSDLKYVLPAVGGNANQVLSVVSKTGAALNDTTITLGWVTAGSSGSDWSLLGNASTSPATNFLGTTDAQDLELRVNGSPLSATSRRIRLYTGGGLQRFDGTTLPNSPGSGSVDWQSSRAGAAQVASGTNSAIGGGSNNTSSNTNSTVAGGTTNTASAVAATVGGGTTNTASNQNSTVAGGSGNTASGTGSTISGGVSNIASNQNTTVSGGTANNASGITSTIGGGTTNVASNQNTTIAGGSGNTASGIGSTVGGGVGNTASGANSVIPGGNGLTVAGNSFGFSGSNSSANAGSIGSSLAYFGDVNLIIGNIDNTARELRFYEANASSTFAGASYTAFRAGSQASNVTYTLPTAAPAANGYILSSTTGGTMSWLDLASVFTVNNGVTLTGSTVQLGGTLIQNTTVAGGNFNMSFQKTGTGNVQLTNNGTANQLQLFEPSGSGTNFSAFLSQAQTSDLKYVMPAVGGNANQVLSIISKSGAASNDTTLTLGWVNAGSGNTNWALLGNATTDSSINFLGTTDTRPLVFRTNNSERMKILASGNVGVGTFGSGEPAVQLDVNGGIATRPSSQSIGANTAVTVGNRSYIRLTNNTGTNWTITLSNGLQDGQILVLQFNYTGAGNLILNDAGNLNLSGNFQPAFTQSSITLIWDGGSWVETARSLN